MQLTFARTEPMIRDVATVLICEPHPEVRELLRRVVVRLGHQPVLDDAALQPVDAILLEPAHPPSVERARAFRAADDHTPIVCASIEPPDVGSRRLSPIAYLVKPFALPDLEHALKRALSTRNGNGRGTIHEA